MAVNQGIYAGAAQGNEGREGEGRDWQGWQVQHQISEPGDIIENIPGLEGVRIYVLGPPQSLDAVSQGRFRRGGRNLRANKELAKSNAFALAVNALAPGGISGRTVAV
jgi:hypothetical protein